MLSPEAFLEEWEIERKTENGECKKKVKNEKKLESAEKLVYSCLGLYPKNPDQIAGETQLKIREVLAMLISLELRGYIREISKNYYVISE